MTNKRQTGKEYEEIAIKYLREKGYFIIEKNVMRVNTITLL